MKKIFEKVDAVIIANTEMKDENFLYFTRLHGLWENSFAIIFPDKIEIVAPPLEEGNAYWYTTKEEMQRLLKKILSVEKVGFNGAHLAYNQVVYLKKLLDCNLVDISNDLKSLRLIKRKDEIDAIRKACRISLKIIENIDITMKKENEIASKIEQKMRKMNALPAFNTIVAFGKNSAIPHHIPTNKKCVMPALIDLGAKYGGYASDITRSFVGRSGKRVYEIVEEALYRGLDEIHDGVQARDVYKSVGKILRKHGYGFRHPLGHSVGIKVHDGFPIHQRSDFMFKENMVFAIEPAVYVKRYGIRIEEDIIIRKDKVEIIR